jgi:pimeloyl-ACP methyl ester carboxylesterase
MIDLDDAVMHGYADSNGVKIHYPSLGKGQLVVLSLNARYDSRLAEPMHNYCRNLTEETIRTGHWMAQEKPGEVNAALVKWLATSVPGVWPRPS